MRIDPFNGEEENYRISPSLLVYLAVFGFVGLDHIRRSGWLQPSRSYYFLAEDYRLHIQWVVEWTSYIKSLNRGSIGLNENDDMLVWIWNKSTSQEKDKEAYNTIILNHSSIDIKWWFGKLWKWHFPLKIKCFFWLYLENYVLTWDNLVRRGWIGPKQYVYEKKRLNN